MTWSNLYSTESKYKVTVNSSVWRQVYLLINLATFVLALQYLYFAAIFWLSSAIFLLLATFLLAKLNSSEKAFIFQLDLMGRCQFSVMDIWQLQSHSFLLPWGCLMLLGREQEGVNQKKVWRTLFIFKDSCSNKDYCRLARVVNKVRANPQDK